MSMALGLFGMGVSVGAVLENKRLTFARLMRRINSLESVVDSLDTTTQEMHVSMAALEARPVERDWIGNSVYVEGHPVVTTGTLVDYDCADVEITQDIPKVEDAL